jgi:hypothetical protein
MFLTSFNCLVLLFGKEKILPFARTGKSSVIKKSAPFWGGQQALLVLSCASIF